MTAEPLGNGPAPEPKLATNKAEAKRDEERGWELLLAVLLGMGLRDYFLQGLLEPAHKMRILDAIVMETSASLTSTTRDLMAGKITARVWFLRMRDILVTASAAGALAILGKHGFNDDERDAWISEINLQYGYLVRFRDGIRDGTRLLSEVAVAASDLYARAIWSTSWRVLGFAFIAAARRDGMGVEALRHLGASDHCSDCLDWNGLGWVDVESDDYHEIGTSICGARCFCWYEYRRAPKP